MLSHNRTRKSLTILLQITLIISSVLLAGGLTTFARGAQSAYTAADAFTIPVSIRTFGNAWNGYLAFGLWQFPYGPTNFSLKPNNYLVVMTTNGQLLYLQTAKASNLGPSISGFAGVSAPTYAPVKYVGQDTLMYVGDPDTYTHFWNLKTNVTTDFSNVYGHHDMIFNPFTGTFLTLRSYVREINGRNVLMDTVVELDRQGNILWTWDTYTNGHFGLKDECLCNATTVVNGQTVIDLTHANSLQWNFQTNIIYMNMRALDTFCKINKTTTQTVWCLGRAGNFTLLGPDGKQVPSLWYHAHDVQEVQPDVFSMFDNDYDNTTNATNPCPATFESTNAHSRILEITVNEQNMTAWTSWSWTAPRTDWTPYWGSVDMLPNGDWLADFGSQSHYVPGSGIGSPLPNSTGGVVVEVNPRGEVVRTYTFAYGWGLYRVVPIPLQTTSNYNETVHTSPFTITLTTLNDLGGPATIYYRINDGPIESVPVDGQPQITTPGSNNTLEYWSVDSNGIVETPHNILTGISLEGSVSTQTTPSSTSSNGSGVVFVIGAGVVAVVAVLFAVVTKKRRREKRTSG